MRLKRPERFDENAEPSPKEAEYTPKHIRFCVKTILTCLYLFSGMPLKLSRTLNVNPEYIGFY